MRGTVKSYSPYTGYGFIIGEDERDYFVYWSFIIMPGFRKLNPGQELLFDPHESYRGWQARNVRLAEEITEERILKPNPFTPHQPVTEPAKFAGRRDSLLNAVDALFNRKNVFVSGERGIGKTSLAIQLAYMTQGDTYLLEKLGVGTGDYKFDYLVIDHRCFPNQRIEDVIAGLMSSVQNKLTSIERRTGKKITHGIDLKFYKGQLEESYETSLPPELISRFVLDLEESWPFLVNAGYNGLCLFIDELDWLEEGVPMAFFLKSAIEKFRIDGYLDTCFIIAGHESYIATLFEQHRSSLRLFDNVHMKPMAESECREIIDKALGGTSVSISEDAASRIVSLSVGFPTPVHQLGYHSFRFDRDGTIGIDDVQQAVSYVIRELRGEEFTVQHQKIAPGLEEDLVWLIAKSLEESVHMDYLFENTRRYRKDHIGMAVGTLIKKGFVDKVGRRRFKLREPLFGVYLRWKEGFA